MMPTQKPGKSKQDYSTPRELISAVLHRLKILDFAADLAADPSNAVTSYYFTESDDALVQDWHLIPGWLWCNPPFANVRDWVSKAWLESQKGAYIVMLVPASTGSNWWRDFVDGRAFVSYLNGRLTFGGETTPYPKDCVLLFYTPWGFEGGEIWDWNRD